MSSISRLVQVGYLVGLSLVLSLLLWPRTSSGQGFGISTGFRATPALPIIAFPVFSSGSSGIGGGSGGGASGFGGGGGAGGVSVSFSSQPQIVTIDIGHFFPNNGQIIGLPGPTFTPGLNNFLSDSTGAITGLIFAVGAGGGGGGTVIGGGGIAGGGAGGFGGGGIPGGGGGLGGGGVAGGMGGFAGKGMGGFNGKKAL